VSSTSGAPAGAPPGSGELERFGYEQSFERSVSRFASFAVAFSFISITTGIFTTYGSVLVSSGPLGIWTWPIVVAGQLCVALVLGSLAARFPVTGYAYQWMSRLAHPLLGWLVGWVSFTFLVVVVVAVDYSVASTVFPKLFKYTGTADNAWAVTAGVILVQGLLVAFSTRWSERVNNAAVVTELAGILGLIFLLLVVGAIAGDLDFGHLFSKGSVSGEGYWSLGHGSHVGPWVLGFLLGAFTIVGFESAANLAEETHDPETVVPRAMWQAVLSAGVIGFLFLIAVTVASGDPKTLAASGTPVADVIERVLGGFVGSLLLVLVAISIFACGLVILITGVRLTWAMSRDERFPGWQVLRRVDATRGTPRNATALVVIVSEAILAIFANRSDALVKLFSAATLLPAIIYSASVLLFIYARRKLPATHGFSLGRFETPVVVLAVIWLAFELAIFRDASFKDPWIYVGVMTAIGVVYLLYLVATRGVRGLAMPEMASIDAELDAAAAEPTAATAPAR
jgi:amino acid transporter